MNTPLSTSPSLHARLEDMRTRLYRRRNAAPYASTQGFPDTISLCEGGCLLRPHPLFFTTILDTFADYLNQPLQIYPQQNMLQPLLDKLEDYHLNVCGLPADLARNILFAMGSSQILEAMLAVVKKPDGIVLMPTSCYHAFIDWPLKWGMSSLCIPTTATTGYKLLAEDLEAWLIANPTLAPRISMLLLANPTTAGVVYTAQQLEALSRIIAKYQLPVFMDEVYRGTEYAINPAPSLASYPHAHQWVVTANSPSKAWQCANLRAGWAAVPEKWRQPMQRIINNSVTELPFILQGGLLGALHTPPEYLDIFRTELGARSALCLQYVKELNIQLNLHHGTQGQHFIKIPFQPVAGHFVVLEFNPYAHATTPTADTLATPLEFGAYLHDFTHNGQPAGITLSAGYSKGHEDYSFYLSFAQLGFEEVSRASQPTELAAMYNSILEKMARNEHFQNTPLPSAAIPVPQPDIESGIQRGRDLLAESFRRMGLALQSLMPTLPSV